MAIGPIKFFTVVPSAKMLTPLANLDDKKMAVGPSAPPIIPIAPASGKLNPKYKAPSEI